MSNATASFGASSPAQNTTSNTHVHKAQRSSTDQAHHQGHASGRISRTTQKLLMFNAVLIIFLLLILWTLWTAVSDIQSQLVSIQSSLAAASDPLSFAAQPHLKQQQTSHSHLDL
jgi:hypothetical protein